MHLDRVVFLTTLLTACMVMPASAQDAIAVSRAKTDGDCTCPKEGRWNAQNLEGFLVACTRSTICDIEAMARLQPHSDFMPTLRANYPPSC